MVQDANHTLSSRRDAREQEQLIATAANMTMEFAKPIIRFQSDLLNTLASSAQVFAKIYEQQADAVSRQVREQLSSSAGYGGSTGYTGRTAE